MKMRNVVLLALATVSLAGCNTVSPGNVGVEVTSWGPGAGVDEDPKQVGMYFTGMRSTVYEYPVSTQTYVWSASSHEGTANNEEFSFNDNSGLTATADIGISWHADPTKAPALYQKYRMDTDGLIAGPIRNAVRNALILNSSGFTIEDIYAAKKGYLINKVQQDVQNVLGKYGIIVEQVYWAGGPRIPSTITDQINKKIANQNAALAAEAAVATATAEAQSKVAKAKGDAEATRIEGEAITSNPQILKQQFLQKWDGHLPTYVAGSASNMITIPNGE